MSEEDFSEFIGGWRDAVGSAVLNFGEIEWITHEYLVRFSSDKIGKFTSRQMLAPRVHLLKEIMAGKEGIDDMGASLNNLLDRTLELAKDRNVIVHNPLQINVYSDKDENYVARDELVSYRNQNKIFALENVQEFSDEARKLSVELRSLFWKLDEKLFP